MPIPTKQKVNFTFQDPAGNPMAGGRVEMYLSTDASLVGASLQVAAGKVATATLDSTGSCSPLVWRNSDLSPTNTAYTVRAYSAKGQLVWQSSSFTVDTHSGDDYLLQENTDFFLTEDGSGFILLEN